MPKLITADKLVSKHLTQKDRVLLVNPPVEETRYSWIRWNQPLDLLKLGSFLRTHVRCEVDLVDCMRPSDKGEVKEEWLPRARRYLSIQNERYPMRRYGESASLVADYIREKLATDRKKVPTHIWITSLCSYWYETIAETCRVVRQTLPDVQIALLGQYPRLMPEHAKLACPADFIVTKSIDLEEQAWSLDLYGKDKPPFVAVRLHPRTAAEAVKSAVENSIYDVTFFEEDICRDGGEPLAEFVSLTENLHRHLRYHVICGLEAASITPKAASTLARKKFVALSLEEADQEGGAVNADAYRRVTQYLREAGGPEQDDRLTGFVWIGRPNDQLEQIIRNVFQVLKSLGSIILKPYTPLPGGPDHKAHADYLDAIEPHRMWSPHFFPFAELNGITRGEYHDLYRMAAFLNEKVRARAFDFLDGTLGAQLLRESLRKEVWKLEPSPLRVVD